jgi:hypothetical protein
MMAPDDRSTGVRTPTLMRLSSADDMYKGAVGDDRRCAGSNAPG